MKTKDLTRIAMMAAVLCILAPISIPIPVSSVALTLATFALYLMAYILNPRQAFAAVGLYLLLGAMGLPVFSGYIAGVSRFAAPGGGYLIGYLFLVGISIFQYSHANPWNALRHTGDVSDRHLLDGIHNRNPFPFCPASRDASIPAFRHYKNHFCIPSRKKTTKAYQINTLIPSG